MTSRTAIVTGGASGIGLAISRRLVGDGTVVAIFDVDGGAARDAATEICTDGGKAIGLAVDVADRTAIDAAVTEVRSTLGPRRSLSTMPESPLPDRFSNSPPRPGTGCWR